MESYAYVLESYLILSEEECFAAIEAQQGMHVQNDSDQEYTIIDAHASVFYKDDETLIIKCNRGFTPAMSLHIKPVLKSVLSKYGKVSITEAREYKDKYTVYMVSVFPKYQRSNEWTIDDMKQTFVKDLKLKTRNITGIGSAIAAVVITAVTTGIALRAGKRHAKAKCDERDKYEKFTKEVKDHTNKLIKDSNERQQLHRQMQQNQIDQQLLLTQQELDRQMQWASNQSMNDSIGASLGMPGVQFF